MSIISEVVVRAYSKKEKAIADAVKMPCPLVFPGQVLRCTNANASDFSYMQRYRIERMAHPVRGGVALAVVRDNNGAERVIPSTAWGFGHWELAR